MRTPAAASHKTLRVGFVGAGYIADYHARALQTIPQTSLIAVCDANSARASQFAATHGVPHSYSDLQRMLSAQSLDVVHVLVPPDGHLEIGIQLLDARVHVLFEKPLCTSAADCRHLSQLAADKRKLIGTNHNFLFAGVYEKLRAVVRHGGLGRLDHVDIVWNKFLPQARFGPYAGFMLRRPENIMLEVGPHSVAHLLDLLGEVETLTVRADQPLELPGGSRFFQRWEVDAAQGATRARLRFSFIQGYSEHRIQVRGTLGSVTADFERDVFQMQHHRALGLDFDRFAATASESFNALRQGTGTLARYALGKAKLTGTAAPFQASITASLQAFYAALAGSPDTAPASALDVAVSGPSDSALDERHASEFATRVVAFAERIGREAQLEPAPPGRVSSVVNGHPPSPADVVVTGATGFIGRELVRQLVASGRRVRVVTRSRAAVPPSFAGLPLEVAAGSLGDPEFLKRAVSGARHVVHLARSQGTTFKEYEQDDIEVTRQLAQACLEGGIERFVYASSIVIYDTSAKAGVITEETAADSRVVESQVYAKAKLVSERLLEEMHREKGLPLVIVRPGIVLGAGGNPCHWGIGRWHHDFVCETWGAGTAELPVVLVQDVADAIVRCLSVPGIEGESFNLVGDAKLSAQQYLDELERAAGARLQRYRGSIFGLYVSDLGKWAVKSLAGYPDRTRPSMRAALARTNAAPFDCSKAKRILGWQPATDLQVLIREGIQRPVAEFMS